MWSMINDTIEEVGGNHTTLADAGCNGEPFRQVISDTNTAFTVGVEEFKEAEEFWGSARDADEIPEGYAVDAVEGSFKIYECDV